MDSILIKNNGQDLQDFLDFFISGFRKKPEMPKPLRGISACTSKPDNYQFLVIDTFTPCCNNYRLFRAGRRIILSRFLPETVKKSCSSC